jgi:hypothetical protein
LSVFGCVWKDSANRIVKGELVGFGKVRQGQNYRRFNDSLLTTTQVLPLTTCSILPSPKGRCLSVRPSILLTCSSLWLGSRRSLYTASSVTYVVVITPTLRFRCPCAAYSSSSVCTPAKLLTSIWGSIRGVLTGYPVCFPSCFSANPFFISSFAT